MKKIITVILAIVLLAALYGCSGADTNDAGNSETPAPAAAKEISPDEVPDQLKVFLSNFTDWYQGNKYDCEDTDGCLLLDSVLGEGLCVDWSLYTDKMPVKHWSDGTSDPRGWCEASGGCYAEYDKKTVDDVTMKVFNINEDQLEKQIEFGLDNKLFYAEGDKYYRLIGGIGDTMTEYRVTSASFDGDKYYVDYDCYFTFDEGELAASYTAVAGKKKDGDKEYWSLYSMNRTDSAPADVPTEPVSVDILTQRENDTITSESTGEEYSVAILRLTAVDAEGNTLWEYSTPPCIPTELDTVQYLGTYGGRVYVNEQAIYDEGRPESEFEHHLYALDAATGNIVWDNTDFRGAGVHSAYDDATGILYLCGYYGPDCCAINSKGETLWTVGDIDESVWWPYKINLREEEIEIVFDGSDEENSDGPYYGYISYDGKAFAG